MRGKKFYDIAIAGVALLNALADMESKERPYKEQCLTKKELLEKYKTEIMKSIKRGYSSVQVAKFLNSSAHIPVNSSEITELLNGGLTSKTSPTKTVLKNENEPSRAEVKKVLISQSTEKIPSKIPLIKVEKKVVENVSSVPFETHSEVKLRSV